MPQKREFWHKKNDREHICPMCGSVFLADKHNKKVCSEQCRDAAVRYAYAKHKYKIGRLQIEPNFDDYKKGGRLYGENK